MFLILTLQTVANIYAEYVLPEEIKAIHQYPRGQTDGWQPSRLRLC